MKQVGHAVLRVPNTDQKGETIYLITLPQLVLYGILTGSPYIELQGQSYICSSTGYLATLHYGGKGYFSGKAHTFKATISPSSQASHALYSIEGEWSGLSKFKGASPTDGKDAKFWDATGDREEVSVKPVEDQGEMESRKVWKKTADGIKSHDFEGAGKDKARIEVSSFYIRLDLLCWHISPFPDQNEQRQKRKDEAAHGTPHQLEYFVHIDDDKEYADLAKQFGHKPATEDAYRRKRRVH